LYPDLDSTGTRSIPHTPRVGTKILSISKKYQHPKLGTNDDFGVNVSTSQSKFVDKSTQTKSWTFDAKYCRTDTNPEQKNFTCPAMLVTVPSVL